jgi:hypothetical protein
MPREVQIVVCEGGWVLVGEPKVVGGALELSSAHVIRRWGTTKGLGQIALNGPTKDTVLDKLGVAFIQFKQVRFTVPCDESKWKL